VDVVAAYSAKARHEEDPDKIRQAIQERSYKLLMSSGMLECGTKLLKVS